MEQNDDEKLPLERSQNRRQRSEGDWRWMQRLGNRLARARRAKKLTQEELAPLLGFDVPASISSWEKGRFPITSLDIAKLSHILDRPVWWFYGERVKPQTYADWRAISQGDTKWARRHHQLELSYQEQEDLEAQE